MYACLHAEGNSHLLVECARQFSPFLEETPPHSVVLDLRGLRLLYGEPGEIATAIANRAGIPVNVAIAGDPDSAVFAARGFTGITVIPPGTEASVLASLPLNLLPGSPDVAEILDAWGIRTFGDLAALPPLGVAARLGTEGTHLQNLASGRNDRQLRALENPLHFEEELELEYPVELLEPLSFLLGRLLHDLCARLVSRALAADEIRLELGLENTEPHRCALRLPVPMCDALTFLKLLQLELNDRPPGAPILQIRIVLNPVKPRVQQHGLFVAQCPEPAKLEVTLAHLSNLLGVENVGTPEVLDSHRPDAFRMNRFVPVHRKASRALPPHPSPVLRRFRPPRYAQVLFRGEKPVQLSALQIQGEVLACLGPWRSSGEWWKREPWDREEWDMELSDGAWYRIHQDRLTSRWFVEGTYD